MSDVLTDIAAYLASKNIGEIQVNIFRGTLPDQPDVALAVYLGTGLPPVPAMAAEGGDVQRRPTVQVICRAAKYDEDTARINADAVFAALSGMAEQVINGTRYTWSWPRQEPYALGPDANGRPRIGCNYDIMRDAA